MVIPRGRRAYNRVAAGDAQEDAPATADSPLAVVEACTADDETEAVTPGRVDSNQGLADDDDDSEDGKERITISIMDPAQTKFQVTVHPDWTIEDLKEEGTKVHKVPGPAQRLIYMGRLLRDCDTLREAGIVKSGTIIHLFPKPRVVVANREEDQATNRSTEEGSAHVPRIVLDPDEAERRSSILVLGSSEVIEAQNNVKLLSFLLLIICSMELLALFTIMLGVPQDDTSGSEAPTPPPETDDMAGLTPGGEPIALRTWQNSDYFDLIISSFGFYVATLGIKATTENTMRLAKRYLYGTILVGIAWNIFYYYLNVQAEKKIDQERVENGDDDFPPLPNSDFYIQALFAILLPAVVWFLCCVRAWQFHQLLREAETEAEERIRNEVSEMEQGHRATNGRTNTSGHDLALQNETATIT